MKLHRGALCVHGHDDGEGHSLRDAHGRCVGCVSARKRRRQADPAHNRYWTHRERAWRQQGITYHGEYLTREVYLKVLRLQRHRCAVCGKRFLPGLKAIEAADHEHLNGNVGPFRGVLCGTKKGCNLALVSRYERLGKRFGAPTDDLIEAYLTNPPASRL